MRNAMQVFPYGGIEYGCGIDFGDFRPVSSYMCEMVQDRAIVTMER